MLRRLLYLPEAEGLDLDSPAGVDVHARIVRGKTYLRRFYADVYRMFADASAGLPDGRRVELGSGGGFIQEVLPQVETSDLIPCDRHDLTFSALDMPFADGELAAIYMLDVLHHLPDIDRFLGEAERCLKPGGRIIMVEPANTCWGRFVYQHFHHEPFLPEASTWTLPEGGPMSAANGALPWIVFVRDHARLRQTHPALRIRTLSYHFPVRYLIAGGVSMRQLLPGFTYGMVAFIEDILLAPLRRKLGMFMHITLEKASP